MLALSTAKPQISRLGKLGFRQRTRTAHRAFASGNDAEMLDPSLEGALKLPLRLVNRFTTAIYNNPTTRNFKVSVAERIAGNEYNRADVRAEIDDIIAQHPVVMFRYSLSLFSIQADEVLRREGVDFFTVEVDKKKNFSRIVAELARMTGRTSMPNIFIGGESIGGTNDGTPGLIPLLQRGELKDRIAKAQDSTKFRAEDTVKSAKNPETPVAWKSHK